MFQSIVSILVWKDGQLSCNVLSSLSFITWFITWSKALAVILLITKHFAGQNKVFLNWNHIYFQLKNLFRIDRMQNRRPTVQRGNRKVKNPRKRKLEIHCWKNTRLHYLLMQVMKNSQVLKNLRLRKMWRPPIKHTKEGRSLTVALPSKILKLWMKIKSALSDFKLSNVLSYHVWR